MHLLPHHRASTSVVPSAGSWLRARSTPTARGLAQAGLALAAALATGPLAQADLIGHWSFDENSGTTVNDSVGSADLSFYTTHGTPQWTPGVSGSALDFNGNSRVESTSTGLPVSHPAASGLSVLFWFNAESWTTPWDHAILLNIGGMRWQDANSALWLTGLAAGPGFPMLAPASGGVDSISLNTWHQLAYTWDGARAKAYLDGVLTHDVPLVLGSVGFFNQTMRVGAENGDFPSSPAHPFNGSIDEIRMYSNPLSQTDIQGLFTSPGGGGGGGGAEVPEAGSVAFWAGCAGLLGIVYRRRREKEMRSDL